MKHMLLVRNPISPSCVDMSKKKKKKKLCEDGVISGAKIALSKYRNL